MPATKELVSSFDETKGAAVRRQRWDFTPSGGSVVKISCRMSDVENKIASEVFSYPGATDDIVRDIGEVQTKSEETITLVDVLEIDTVFTLLGGLNGLVQGTALGYIKSPRDATDKVRTISGAAGAAFAATIRRPDGPVRLGANPIDYAKVSLVLRNVSGAKLVWTASVDMPDTIA